MRFDILTLHPEMVHAPLHTSILGRAVDRGDLEVGITQIRDFAEGRHQQVDDAPYGGGAGMVLKVDVVARALEAVRRPHSLVLLTSPAGAPFCQRTAQRWAKREHIVILCGHYEGIDARIEALVDAEVSLGDFVLTGGEIAAIAIVDAVGRLLPGVLGNKNSAIDESFSDGLLEYPHYTRPRIWKEQEVPAVLLSGNHGVVDRWREAQRLVRTRDRRPDLLKPADLAGSTVDERPKKH